MKKVLIIIIALFIACGVIIPKLSKIAQIKSWIPGAKVLKVNITQKWNQTPQLHPNGRNTFWISWTGTDIRQKGNHRTNVTPEKWAQIKISDEIEIIYVKGDNMPYLRDDIMASPGNFMLDILILAGIIIYVIKLIVSG